MTTTPSPTPEEIEAAARAIYFWFVEEHTWDDEDEEYQERHRKLAEAALKAAMAVRMGK